MWPETIRIIDQVRPRFALLENVPGLRFKTHGYLGRVLGDLAACGYDARWDCLPASALGATPSKGTDYGLLPTPTILSLTGHMGVLRATETWATTGHPGRTG